MKLAHPRPGPPRKGRPGTLELFGADGQVLRLERDKFPTNARKADKITKNKATKFEKVSSRIIERVLHAAPGTPLENA